MKRCHAGTGTVTATSDSHTVRWRVCKRLLGAGLSAVTGTQNIATDIAPHQCSPHGLNDGPVTLAGVQLWMALFLQVLLLLRAADRRAGARCRRPARCGSCCIHGRPRRRACCSRCRSCCRCYDRLRAERRRNARDWLAQGDVVEPAAVLRPCLWRVGVRRCGSRCCCPARSPRARAPPRCTAVVLLHVLLRRRVHAVGVTAVQVALLHCRAGVRGACSCLPGPRSTAANDNSLHWDVVDWDAHRLPWCQAGGRRKAAGDGLRVCE
jgi:hypothetical protein